MSLTLRSQYWDDPAAKAAFQAFILEQFGLDFSEWDDRGFWDHAYTPFSLFDGDRVVANACFYLLDAVIRGEATHLLQISAVATHPDLRRKGLCRQLTEVGLAWAEGRHCGTFLFSTEMAVPVYRKLHFTPVVEYVEQADLAPRPRRGRITRFDPTREADLARMYGYARDRAPVSHRFAVQSPKLVMFHALHSLRDHAWEIPDLGCLVFFERDATQLTIFDVVGPRIPTWDELCPYLAEEGDRTVELRFPADRMDLRGGRRQPLEENLPFVDAAFPVQAPVIPYTAQA